MSAVQATEEPIAAPARPARRRFAAHLWLVPGLVAVGLMLVWAVHDGGYDEDTWYWGALVLLAVFAAVVIARGPRAIAISRPGRIALLAFTLYVAWSYLSISWAQSPGDALEGSNRALLYLLVFATMLVLPWTARGALIALLTFVSGVGVVAVVLLVRLASADRVAQLLISGRLAAPTGYFNASAALFTIMALTAIVLAARRELPGLLRGLLIAFACAGLQLAVVVQSRGWLFTLPLVAVVAIAIVPDRLRVAASAVLPIAAALVPLHRLLAVYQAAAGGGLAHAASRAGQVALLLCALAFVVATIGAWGDSLISLPRPGQANRRVIGWIATMLALVAIVTGAVAATHGHPVRFISRQWNGFSHPQSTFTGSHFTDVGSGRYDFWRVALDAFLAHPIGGLGQDNFADYYVTRRRTSEDPAWTHSLELRLLAHTGAVGFALFAAFLVAAVTAAIRARRRLGRDGLLVGAALLPLVVWLIHGSVDWFWEIPALSGPALGFLAVAVALGANERGARERAATRTLPAPLAKRATAAIAATAALLAAVAVLGFPYLSVREVSLAGDVRETNPAQALSDLRIAADLNPLSADPGRIGGTIALQGGRYTIARQRFLQATAREPGGWYGWLGAGLSASALGEKATARHDFAVAASINPTEAVVRDALAQVGTAHPLMPSDALRMLALSL